MSMYGYAVTFHADGTTGYRAIASEADLLPGETFAAEPPAPTLADVSAALTADVQAWLDATAQGNGYDSIASCISYRGSAVTQWNDDAVAALAWRDAVWQAAFQWQQDALANPPSTFPTSQEVIAQLPQPAQYGWVVHAPGSAG
ncbi:hypothetical protein ACFWZU_15745 [Frateuria sp. GZRR33]|uniref:hypothetical protein n=1 Tax=Frateuria sp. GZRR33 TaxID=3351535 RepID=UPI003EDC8389